jgi:hypothetical protein
MNRFTKQAIRYLVCASIVVFAVTFTAMAQSTGGTTGSVNGYNFNGNYHVGFNTPEAWGLKYFTSSLLVSGLTPPEPEEGHRVGAISIGFEVGWLPHLNAGQRQIGFGGLTPEDLNKSPVTARPIVRIGLPWKLTGFIAAPPPFEVSGINSRMLALGLERPIYSRDQWTVSWRGYGQFGYVRGSFTCPTSVLAFAPGPPNNPTECVGESNDKASLRYVGSEFQVAYKLRSMPKLIPHVAVGGNFIDGAFEVNAPVQDGQDHTREWTRGGTLSTSGGITYMLTKHASFGLDAFYSPLWVQRTVGGPTQNDGLFNIRALINYTIR